MNKKIIIGSVGLVVVLLAAAIYLRYDRFLIEALAPVPKLEKEYINKQSDFSLRTPADWVVITQNKDATYADYLLISNTDETKVRQHEMFQSNPFAAALDVNAVGIHVTRNANPWVQSLQEQGVREYLESSLSTPDGAQATVTLHNFKKETVGDGAFYSYNLSLTPEYGVFTNGHILTQPEVMFQVENLNLEYPVSAKLLKAVARSIR